MQGSGLVLHTDNVETAKSVMPYPMLLVSERDNPTKITPYDDEYLFPSATIFYNNKIIK